MTEKLPKRPDDLIGRPPPSLGAQLAELRRSAAVPRTPEERAAERAAVAERAAARIAALDAERVAAARAPRDAVAADPSFRLHLPPNFVTLVWYEREGGPTVVVGVYHDAHEAARKVDAMQAEDGLDAAGIATRYHCDALPVIGAERVVPAIWGTGGAR